MKNIVIVLLMSFHFLFAQNHAPQVTNVTFNQRADGSYKVDIYYNLYDEDGDAMTVTMQVSDDAGETWNLSCQQISGDVGENITGGTGKHIVWDFGAEHPDAYYDRIQIKVIADDGYVTPGLVEMVYVQGGTFQMGDKWGDGSDVEKPVHEVTVSDFYISKYEITQKQYEEIMGENPSYFIGDNLPVEKVTWYNAVDFCNKLSEREGLEPCYTINGTDVSCDFSKSGYRLPTEAEWEYAATGGINSKNTKYSGSNNVDEVGWYSDNSSNSTQEIGKKDPNELGIYDMSGNVWEWCWDWYDTSYYASSATTNPTGPEDGSSKVLRGGSWRNPAQSVRVSNRGDNYPSEIYYTYGFRIVKR